MLGGDRQIREAGPNLLADLVSPQTKFASEYGPGGTTPWGTKSARTPVIAGNGSWSYAAVVTLLLFGNKFFWVSNDQSVKQLLWEEFSVVLKPPKMFKIVLKISCY